MEKCYRCGYCCKHYKLDGKTILAYMHEIADVDMDIKGPCKNLSIDKKETKDYQVYQCNVYRNRPQCCANLNAEKILLENIFSKESLEERILQGEDTPHCVVAKLLGEEHLLKARQKI